MKFGVGVRVKGRSGVFSGVEGRISSRVKVGTQNLLEIRWSDGRVTRVGTGAVTVLRAGGPNEGVVPVNEEIGHPQVGDSDGDGSEDEMSQRSQSSEEESRRDMGDQDG